MRKAILAVSALAIATWSSIAVAAVNNYEVTSIKIATADNISSQNTATGAGVKTGHIANNAVTNAKLAVSAVTATTLSDGAVITSKILDSAVTSSKIATGAVTDAKISGTISATKIAFTGLNADTVDGLHASSFAATVHTHTSAQVTGLDTALGGKSDTTHNHDGIYQNKYANIIIVAMNGGDFSDPASALASINDASATNPYLIKIMPGIYTPETGCLMMKNYIDIEGSGRNTTKIIGYIMFQNGTDGISNSELRNMTIESGADVIQMQYSSPTLRDLNIHSLGWGTYGIRANNSSNPTLNNINISLAMPGTGIGIFNGGSAQTHIENVTLDGTAVASFNGITMQGVQAELRQIKIVGFNIPSNPFAHGIAIDDFSLSGSNVRIFDSSVSKVYVGSANDSATGANVQVDEFRLGMTGAKFKCINCFSSTYDSISFP